MPGLPLVARETTCSRSRTADQMCRQNSRGHLTPEEVVAAEESLSVYCKPVELYNILQRRAMHNPPFLQRCLHYKIQAKHRHRIQLNILLSANMNDEAQFHGFFPLYMLLARPVSDAAAGEHSSIYRLSRACILPSSSEFGRKDQLEASFVIPEVRKLLTDVRSRNLVIFLLCNAKLEGNCIWGKLSLEALFSAEKYEALRLGQRVEMLSTIDMYSSVYEPTFMDVNGCLSFQAPLDFGAAKAFFQVKVSISALEVGAGERSPYDSYAYDDVPSSPLPHIMRLRAGNVIFNYKYYNNSLQKTEVTEDFSCPFCLARCASYKGLQCHLTSSHDLFNFEFWVTEEYQAVNVSVKTDVWRSEIVADGVDPRLQTFSYWSRPNRQRRSLNLAQNVNHVHGHTVKLDSPSVLRDSEHLNGGPSAKEEECSRAHYKLARYGSENTHSESAEQIFYNNGTVAICSASAQAPIVDECNQPASGGIAMLQLAKTKKLSVEKADPKNRLLLQKRQFFHSHRAQPMALEQVLSDRDSEDEVDDDIADFEDRRMLDDFVDVTKDEKQIMHLWNSFVRKQRVLADGHIPWACEAFTQLHGHDFVREPTLMWCWRLFMVKLWNHSLLDARTMNNCNLLLEKFQSQVSDPKQC